MKENLNRISKIYLKEKENKAVFLELEQISSEAVFINSNLELLEKIGDFMLNHPIYDKKRALDSFIDFDIDKTESLLEIENKRLTFKKQKISQFNEKVKKILNLLENKNIASLEQTKEKIKSIKENTVNNHLSDKEKTEKIEFLKADMMRNISKNIEKTKYKVSPLKKEIALIEKDLNSNIKLKELLISKKEKFILKIRRFKVYRKTSDDTFGIQLSSDKEKGSFCFFNGRCKEFADNLAVEISDKNLEFVSFEKTKYDSFQKEYKKVLKRANLHNKNIKEKLKQLALMQKQNKLDEQLESEIKTLSEKLISRKDALIITKEIIEEKSVFINENNKEKIEKEKLELKEFEVFNSTKQLTFEQKYNKSIKEVFLTKKLIAVYSSIFSIVIGLFIGLVIMLSVNPSGAGEGFKYLISYAFDDNNILGNSLFSAAILILTGLSFGFAARSGLFNIGASGQLLIAGIMGLYVGNYVKGPNFLVFILVLIVGIIMGAIWGGTAGVLKAYFNVNEVIVTIMLNFIALYIGIMLAKSPKVFDPRITAVTIVGRHGTVPNMGFSKIFGNISKADAGIVIAIIIAVIYSLILTKTTLGYQIKAVGHSTSASNYAGISTKKNTIFAMMIAGVAGGIAGILMFMGKRPVLYEPIAHIPQEGFDGLAVSLLAANNPIGIIFTAIFISLLKTGSLGMQFAGFNTHIANVIVSVIIYLAALSSFVGRRFSVIKNSIESKIHRKRIDYINNNKENSKKHLLEKEMI